MDKFRLGFICSFLMQREMIRKIADEFSDRVEVMIDIGVLEGAVPVARRLEHAGAEVVVCWGRTASILETVLSVPVVGVRIHDFDIMRAVIQASKRSRRVALLTPWRLNGVEILEELLDIEIKQILFNDSNDVVHGIAEAVNEGFGVIVGRSHLTLDSAREYGVKAVLITFNPDNVRDAFHEALRIAALRRKEREDYNRIETIFNSLTEGVAVSGMDGNITLLNSAARQILGLNNGETFAYRIDRLLPGSRVEEALTRGINLEHEIICLNDISIIASHKPILVNGNIVGIVSTFRETQEIQKIDTKIRNQMISRGFVARYSLEHFAAESRTMKLVLKQAEQFAKTNSTILITGETGTGKEVMAQSIHRLSARSKEPFIAINCNTLPENLLESELFGYVEGAFTGAKKGGKTGLFELAHSGTIFLDEIGTMPIKLQSRLLRVLQERQVMRLGAEELIPIDARVIAATNKDLTLEIKNGSFREDLYYRLNVLAIKMPPLRERRDDISILAKHFISHFCNKYRKEKMSISRKLMMVLQDYAWPGNVRQLEHVIERFVLLYDGKTPVDSQIRDCLDYYPCDEVSIVEGDFIHKNLERADELGILEARKESEKDRIIKAMSMGFSISRTAQLLRMSRTTLYRKIRNFGID